MRLLACSLMSAGLVGEAFIAFEGRVSGRRTADTENIQQLGLTKKGYLVSLRKCSKRSSRLSLNREVLISCEKLPSTSIAAKCMGHDIAVHHRTYHQHYNRGMGFNRTKVWYHGTPVRTDLKTIKKWFTIAR